MSKDIFLKEMRASVALFDVRSFSALSSRLGPMDLGISLGRFYRHVEDAVQARDGQIVKFVSDAVVAMFPSVGDADHAGNALKMLRELTAAAPRWSAENEKLGLPGMTYSIGVASGTVLHGELGTDNLRMFDVLGKPATLASKLARLATVRDTLHLVDAASLTMATADVPRVEVEGAEFGGEPVRLYRILSLAVASVDEQGKA